MGESIKLNLGAGSTVIDGWTAIDRKLGTEVYPLPQYADNTVDEIRASHVLEHLSFGEAHRALAEWHRVLKPGGKIRIAVPDMDKILACDHPKKRHFLMGGQLDENDFHKSAWDVGELAHCLRDAGFDSIVPWNDDVGDISSSPVSLNLEARKKSAATEEGGQIKVAAIMSVPRVGWTDNFLSVQRALMPFKIPVYTFNGVFWGQCMTRAIENCLEMGLDWILTVDYDSVFTTAHLSRLIQDFGSTPEADAMFPLQVRRGSPFPLATFGPGQTKVGVNGEMMEAHTGHFGLTLLRVDAIRKLIKPWFLGVPSENKDWNDGRTDEDIYFWLNWKQAGNKLYMTPNVAIGHLECMVAEFDDELKPRHVYVSDWRKKEGLDK